MEIREAEPHIVVEDLTVAYGSNVILHDLTFTINRGDIFIIMGASGGGKSTVLRSMVGLLQPTKGQVLYDGLSFWSAGPEEQKSIMRKFGVLYQGGALWSSLTLAENVALPLQQYTDLSQGQIEEDRLAQARACRTRRLRGVLSIRDQRRHEEARRTGPRHGIRP